MSPRLPGTLPPNPELAMSTSTVESLYPKIERFVPRLEWDIHRPKIERILELKKERNAVILAHTYQSPWIYHTVADIKGDSLQLARLAADVEADVIVMAGVNFMADTAKIVNPTKTVLMPDLDAGCSLAESITAEDVRALRQKYPGVPVVTYVNTDAAVKAESDICCTSSNAVEVVESLGVPRIIFLPDKFLGTFVASQVPSVEVILWEGACMVHERFTAGDIAELRRKYPDVKVLAHPECPPDVLDNADYVGSTSGMSKYVHTNGATRIALVTECSMSANVAADNPDVEIVRPCQLCPHMQKITLDNIITSLEKMEHEVVIPPDILERARLAIDRMLAVRVGVRGA